MSRLGIFGGCVSRDVLNYTVPEDRLSLAFYTARCSFASLAGKPYVQHQVLKKVSSEFQKNQISADMHKTFFRTVSASNLDMLLMDFISQRYPVMSDRDGGLLTMSNDYMRSAPRPLEGRIIRHTTDMYSKLWLRGFEKFSSAMERLGKFDKIFLSELFWTKNSGCNVPFSPDILAAVDKENEYLASLYEKFASIFGKDKLIVYPAELLVADPLHRWGHTPYHYAQPLYHFTLAHLKKSR